VNFEISPFRNFWPI